MPYIRFYSVDCTIICKSYLGINMSKAMMTNEDNDLIIYSTYHYPENPTAAPQDFHSLPLLFEVVLLYHASLPIDLCVSSPG